MLSSKVFRNGYGVSGSNEFAKNEKDDCVVRAFANAFGISYNQSHKFTSDKFNRKFKKGTFKTYKVLKDLKKVEFNKDETGQLSLFGDDKINKTIKYIGSEPKKESKVVLQNKSYKHKPVAYTVNTFMKNFKNGTYILFVKGHSLVVKNGVMIDNPNYQFTGYRRVVESAFQVKNGKKA